MSSLATCIKKAPKSRQKEIKAVLKEAQDAHLADKLTGQEAKVQAVKDVLAEYEAERANIMAQVRAAIGENVEAKREDVKPVEKEKAADEDQGRAGDVAQSIPVTPEKAESGRTHLVEDVTKIGDDATKSKMLAAIAEARKQLPEPDPKDGFSNAETIVWPKAVTYPGAKTYTLPGGYSLVQPKNESTWRLYHKEDGKNNLENPIFSELADAKKFAEYYLLGKATPEGPPHVFTNPKKSYSFEIPNSAFHLDNFEKRVANSSGVKFSEMDGEVSIPANIRAELESKLGKSATAALYRSGMVEEISQEEAEGIAGGGPDQKFSKSLDLGVKDSDVLEVGDTPDVLIALGAKPYKLVITGKVINKVTKGKHKGALDVEGLMQVQAGLYNPVAVFRSSTEQNSLVVLTEVKDKSGKMIVVPVLINGRLGRNDVNIIKSVYGKDDINRWVAAESKNLVYVNTQKAASLRRDGWLHLPAPGQTATGAPVRGRSDGGSTQNILTQDNVVKKKVFYSRNGQIQGIATGTGKVYLVKGGIESGRVYDVVAHEVGTHVGKLLQGNAGFKRVVESVEARKDEDSETGEKIRKAYAKVPEGTNPEHVNEEALAYLIEHHPEVGIARRVISIIKSILIRLGVKPDILTAADFRALADLAVRYNARKAQMGLAGKDMAEGVGDVMRSVRDIFKPVDTNSREFKEWLGNSAVKVPVFSGQPKGREIFDSVVRTEIGGVGFFTDAKWVAELYAGVAKSEKKGTTNFSGGRKGEVGQYYLSLQNPWDPDVNEVITATDWLYRAAKEYDEDSYNDLSHDQKIENGFQYFFDKYGYPDYSDGVADYRENGGTLRTFIRDVINSTVVGTGNYTEGIAETSYGALAITERDFFDEFVKEKNIDGIIYRDGEHERTTTYVPFSPTQIKSAISNTGAFSKDDPRIKYSFAGPKSSTSNLDAAKAMQAAGVDRSMIWRDTGWWQMGDQWSYELDDSMSNVKMQDGLLSDVLKQKEIFKAYPALDKVLVRFMDLGDTQRGSFNPNTSLIKINSNFGSEQQRSALHHEVQHIIQMQEGYATGKKFDTSSTANQEQYWRSPGEVEARLVQARLNMTPTARKETPPWITLERMLKKEGLLKPGQKVEDALGAVERGSGEMLAVPVSDQPAEKAATNPLSWDAPLDSKKDTFLYNAQNKFIDLFRVQDAITKVGGEITEDTDVKLAEALYHKRSAKRVEDFLVNEVKPLMAELGKIDKDEHSFEKYLHARHAEEANEALRKRNPNAEELKVLQREALALRDRLKVTPEVVDFLKAEAELAVAEKDVELGNSDDSLVDTVTSEMAVLKRSDNVQEYILARDRHKALRGMKPYEGDNTWLSGMKTDDANAYVAALGADKLVKYEALAAKWDKVIADTRRTLVEYELESQETVDRWAEEYQYYIPLNREDMDGGVGIGQGYSVKGSSTRARTGSTKNVVDVLANIVMQREKAIVRGEKAGISRALYGLAQANPNDNFWTIEIPPTQPKIDPVTGLVQDVADIGFKNRPNVVVNRFYNPLTQKMEERAVVFNERNDRAVRMAEALKNLDTEQLGVILGASAKVTRFFSAMATQYNIVFGAVNLTRDFGAMHLNLTNTPLAGKQGSVARRILKSIPGLYKAVRAETKGQRLNTDIAKAWEEMQLEGGTTGFRDMFENSTERAEVLRRDLLDISAGKLRTSFVGLKQWVSDYNDVLENSTRLSVYIEAKNSGMSNKRAAQLAKEITLNFNRKGKIATQAGAMYAFFNATMQGTEKLYRTMKGPGGRKILAGGLMLGSMQALVLAAAGFDDDEPPEFIRERNVIIPIGGKRYISIPMPLGFHVIPNLSRIPTEWALGGFKDSGDRVTSFLSIFTEVFNPLGNAGFSVQSIAPTPIDPFIALSENKDFTGQPIAKKDFNSLKPTPGHARAKVTASHFGDIVSRGLNYMTGGTEHTPGLLSPTPDQIDYLISQATGGVGRELSKASQSIKATLTGEEVPAHKIPLVGRYYGNSNDVSGVSAKFYNNIKKLNNHDLEIDGIRENGGDTVAYFRDNPEARLVKMSERIYRDVQKLQKLKRAMLLKDAPRERIKAVELQIETKMRLLNNRITAAE